MVLVDDRILEIIREDPDKVGRVKDLVEHENIKVAQSTVSRRCQKLADHGLLRRIGDGVYLLTEKGEGYLDGEISTYVDEPDEIPDQNEGTDSGVAPPSGPG